MPDEGIGGAPDAATVMQQTISEFQGAGEGAAPDTQAATPPDEPSVPPEPETDWYGAPFAGEQDQPNGMANRMADEQPDELATLLNEEAFNNLRETPEGLQDWAQKAFGHLRKYGELAELDRQLGEVAEYIGGWENAEHAFNLFGDLFRGDLPLDEGERAEFPAASGYAERAVLRLMGQNPQIAYQLGAAVLNHMPELLMEPHNAGYLLRTIGLDPQYIEDYLQVAEMGGFQPTADQQEALDWFKAHDIPMEQLGTFQRLPIELQQDLLVGNPNAARFHLQRYHNDRLNQEQAARAAEDRYAQERDFIEYQSAQTLATEQRKVFEDYVAKGKALGLNDLEAAGLAAMAYAEIEGQYWEDGTESRKVVDSWHGHIRSGNKSQIESCRTNYRKAFESAYRRAAGQYSPKRPGLPAPQLHTPRIPGAPNGNNQPQFTPSTPLADELSKLTGAELMDEIMRQHGAIPASR